jgi:iron(III) transport system substrate-binding protein
VGSKVNSGRTRLTILLVIVAALLAAVASTASAHTYTAAATPGKPATKAQWAKLVAQAKKEGSVTIYSSQNPITLAVLADNFKKLYGVSVTINRNIDGTLATQVGAEESSHHAIADMWVSASKPLVLGSLKNGWVTDAVGPNLFAQTYDRSVFGKPGKAFVVGEAILGVAWNTQEFSGTVRDLTDVLRAPSGRIGVIIPSAPAIVDWYLWVQQTYGKSFLTKLAALHPKKYPSALPMGAAVESGEIAVGTFVAPTVLDDKAKGAPINWMLPKGKNAWNAPYYGMILKQAPHPAAAQLLADYMVTSAGQAAVMKYTGSVYKGAPTTYYVTPRQQNLKDLTPAKVAEFQAYWNNLFK